MFGCLQKKYSFKFKSRSSVFVVFTKLTYIKYQKWLNGIIKLKHN